MLTDAIIVSKPGAPFQYQQVELNDKPRPDEVLVRIKATGVCHTDLNFAKEASMPDLFPGILGHEGAGIVERVGTEVSKVTQGDHVIVVFSCCGECKYCRRKESSYCDVWFQYNFGVGRLDGSKTFSDTTSGKRITSHFFGQSSFAKHILVSQNGLVKVDKGIPFEKLAPLGCGIMTGAGGKLKDISGADGTDDCQRC
jgi:aryl-alcohol dehydrogenase